MSGEREGVRHCEVGEERETEEAMGETGKTDKLVGELSEGSPVAEEMETWEVEWGSAPGWC